MLLDAESDQIHQLNSTARFIWQRCDGKQSAEEIADLLASEFAVELRVALKDVIETLGKLQTLNLSGRRLNEQPCGKRRAVPGEIRRSAP